MIWTPEMVQRFNRLTKEEIAQAMETLPTDALEWAVKFEALSRPATDRPNEQVQDAENGSD